MELKIITQRQIQNRNYWIEEISNLSGNFGVDAEKVEQELDAEINKYGIESLLAHLRLCGAIPEVYGHDTTEEKLYSKYTDIVIHQAFLSMGINSVVLKGRGDVADVECVTDNFSFVADAKAFRLSRTAKNQKDFKVEAVDGWKHGKPYAIVVCPVYQLPRRSSQIYQQAASRSVFVSTYSHLAVLARFAFEKGGDLATEVLHELFRAVEAMNPSKDATSYWQALNRTMLNHDGILGSIWNDEKQAAVESVHVSREEALTFLAREREIIMEMSRENAIRALLKKCKFDTKIKAINTVGDNGLLEIQ